MAGARSVASLSSGLLARKGEARPAMRRQVFASDPGAALEDLGWNDMGMPDPAPKLVPPVLIERAMLADEVAPAPAPAPLPEPAPPPEPVLIAAPRPVSVATAARLARESAEQTKGGKAAFTLRLDAARHLRLRLASAIANRSAQHLVTEALDQFLAVQPAVNDLVARLPEPRRQPAGTNR